MNGRQDYAGRNRRVAAFPVYMVIGKEESHRERNDMFNEFPEIWRSALKIGES